MRERCEGDRSMGAADNWRSVLISTTVVCLLVWQTGFGGQEGQGRAG